MKKLIAILYLISIWTLSYGQKSPFKNIRFEQKPKADTLNVSYDLTGKHTALKVWLEVKPEGKTIRLAKDISGDIKDVLPGPGKVINWNLLPDSALINEKIGLRICGDILVPRRIPWLCIAAGACAATGVYSHIRGNNIYDDYPPSVATLEAEELRKDANRMYTIRNAAFGAAGILGAAGVIVHIRHNRGTKAVRVSYIPTDDGASFGLTYKF